MLRVASLVTAVLAAVVICPSAAVGQSTVTSTTAGPSTATDTTPASGTTSTQSPASGAPATKSASGGRVPGDCLATGTTGAPTKEVASKTPIKFKASPEAVTRNFGSSRKKIEAVFKLTSESEILPDIKKQLELVADPILRLGETTDSASFPEPTFSDLSISRNHKTIRFRVCLDPASGLNAGKYLGTISLEGPPGVDTTTVTITANAKDGRVFKISAVVALFLAFLVLLYKAANDERARRKAEAEAITDAAKKEAALTKAQKYLSAALKTLKDPAWLVPTLFVLGSAFGALWVAYDTNPSWGEAGIVTSAFAIVGAAFAAIGARQIFAGSK